MFHYTSTVSTVSLQLLQANAATNKLSYLLYIYLRNLGSRWPRDILNCVTVLYKDVCKHNKMNDQQGRI